MNDDYLWDRNGEPDAEVVRIERLLGRYRYERPLRPFAHAPRPRRARWNRWIAACAAMLAFVVIGIGVAIWLRLQWQADRPWEVMATEGFVTIDGEPVTERSSFGVGTVLHTGPRSRAMVRVARIGEIEVAPSSVIRLQSTNSRQHRVVLEQGSIASRIWAPPFSFGVQTPLGLASDLGCEFDLSFQEGAGRIRVTSGWVDFDGRVRSSLIPEAAIAELTADGPGTPYYSDAAKSFVDALREYDRGDVGALARILGEARSRDAMTLLHILERAPLRDRPLLFARAAQLAPPPREVTLERVLSKDDMQAIDTWRRSLGLQGVKRWWLNWRDAIPRER